MISVPQLFCELQRDWARKETVPAIMDLFMKPAVMQASSSHMTCGMTNRIMESRS